MSHTSGRWRKEAPPEKVDGTPWLIPQTERFDIFALGDRLQGSERPTRYTWFDLIFIPQRRSDPIANQEIARQAEIFQNAKYAVVWLNDVTEFSGLNAFVACLAPRALRTPKDQELHMLVSEAELYYMEKAKWAKSSLFEYRDGQRTSLNTWLS